MDSLPVQPQTLRMTLRPDQNTEEFMIPPASFSERCAGVDSADSSSNSTFTYKTSVIFSLIPIDCRLEKIEQLLEHLWIFGIVRI